MVNHYKQKIKLILDCLLINRNAMIFYRNQEQENMLMDMNFYHSYHLQ